MITVRTPSQQPAGADQHTACSGKDHDLCDACRQHENAEHQTRGQNRNIFIAETKMPAAISRMPATIFKIRNCFCTHDFFLFSFEALF